MPTTTVHQIDCCPDQDSNSCCIAFLKLCGYMGLTALSFVACNYLVTITALLDADFNHHEGMYEGVPALTTSLTHLVLLELTFLTLGAMLIRHGLLSTKAFLGVLGSHVLWLCLVNISFVVHMTEDDGKHFRCTGKDDTAPDDEPAFDSFEDVYYDDAVLECMTQLDDGVLHQVSEMSAYGFWAGLVAIMIASAASQWGDAAIDECDACFRVMRFLGEMVWYLFFPPMSGIFIILFGNDVVISKPTPLPPVAAGRRVVPAPNKELTQRLQQANAVDSASNQV